MKLIILLFIAFIEVESRGIDSGVSNGDPAPGRSPGPPSPPKSLLGVMYKVDSQPTADFPTLVLNQPVPSPHPSPPSSESTKNINDKIFPSVSYDNVNDNKDFIDSRVTGKGIMIGVKSDDDELNARALHALKEIPSTLHHAQNGRLDTNNGTTANLTIISSDNDGDSKMPCGNARNLKVNNYLKAGERIVRVNQSLDNSYRSSTQSAESAPSSTESVTSINPHSSSTVKATEGEQVTQTTLEIDVIHDVFSTHKNNGILAGIVYKGMELFDVIPLCYSHYYSLIIFSKKPFSFYISNMT
jgi:hypothetical protein